MPYLETAGQGVRIRFPDGSGVAFQKNAFNQLVEGEYCILGGKTSAEILSMRMVARREVLDRGYTVVL